MKCKYNMSYHDLRAEFHAHIEWRDARHEKLQSEFHTHVIQQEERQRRQDALNEKFISDIARLNMEIQSC